MVRCGSCRMGGFNLVLVIRNSCMDLNSVCGWKSYIITTLLHNNMIQYPLVNISKEEWNKKVTATYMYSIPLED